MDDFSLPGTPNIYGVEPSEANYIQPLRKPLSSMSPVIVRGPAGELRAVVGASGGPRIISSVLQVLLRWPLLILCAWCMWCMPTCGACWQGKEMAGDINWTETICVYCHIRFIDNTRLEPCARQLRLCYWLATALHNCLQQPHMYCIRGVLSVLPESCCWHVQSALQSLRRAAECKAGGTSPTSSSGPVQQSPS